MEIQFFYLIQNMMWRYDGDINKRPKRFLVEYKVGNEPTIQKIFNN